MGIQDLPTLADVEAMRRGKPILKGASRLQKAASDEKDERKEEARWKRDIWKRDGDCCRWCHRAVRKCLELVPDRGECHHISGRVVKDIRWDRRNGALFCASCHERLTGKVDEKHVIVSTKTFTVDGVSYINGDKPLTFKRVC